MQGRQRKTIFYCYQQCPHCEAVVRVWFDTEKQRPRYCLRDGHTTRWKTKDEIDIQQVLI